MTTEIVRHETAASLPEKMEWVRAMAGASLLPRQYQSNPGNLLFAIEYADALGVNRMAAITSIHVIEGKPSASADLIANLVRKAGHKLRVTGDDTYAVAQLIRADDPEFTFEAKWDLDKAKAAGLLGKGVWKNYPGAMLRSRAITEVARMGASDALFGVIYSPEELGATVDDEGDVVHQVTTAQPGAGADRAREALGVAAPPAGAPAAAEPDAITAAQVKKMATSMGELGLTSRETALAFVADVIGRTVDSRNDLTKDEASRVIDRLEQRIAAANPAPDEEGVVDAELVPDAAEDTDPIWAEIVEAGKAIGMTEADLQDDFPQAMDGLMAGSASADELRSYLSKLQGQGAAA